MPCDPAQMIGDEERVVAVFRAWLEGQGWTVRLNVDHCDVVAYRGEERLFAEAKGRTASPGLDIDTLYGQLLRRIPTDGLSYQLGVVAPSEAVTAALRVPSAVRDRLGIAVFEVTDADAVVQVDR
jgi:hypothetical protein